MELKEDYFLKKLYKKNTASLNAEYIRFIGQKNINNYGKSFRDKLEARANRIKGCMNFWLWDKYEINKILDLKRVYRCKDLFCPNCRTWNIAKTLVKFTPKFKELILLNYVPYLMTLTIPNIKGSQLKETIGKMNKAFVKLWNWLNKVDNRKGFDKRIFNAVAAEKVLELTVNESDHSFHVHFHVVIFLESEDENDFIKNIDGGYQYKSKEFIFYSEADTFIQKLWTMAFKGIEIKGFDDQSGDWKDNYICDIRPLELPGGLYETFKYCFKDVHLYDIEVFENIFFGLENKRLKQGYGLLYGINKDDKEERIEILKDYIEIEEDPEELILYQISVICNNYKEYKKISRFKSDEEFKNIKD